MRRPALRWLLAATCGALLIAAAGGLLRAPQRTASAAEAEKPAASAEDFATQADAAVDSGLKYLAAHQLEDGSFDGGAKNNTAVASLCIMAFLAKGYTPGTGPYGDVIDKGIDFVLGSQRDNGLLLGKQIGSGPMYSHSISTLFLSEVSGMVDPDRQKRIDECCRARWRSSWPPRRSRSRPATREAGATTRTAATATSPAPAGR